MEEINELNDFALAEIEKRYSLNKPQVLLASYLMDRLKGNYNKQQIIEREDVKKYIKEEYNYEMSNDDILYVFDKLRSDMDMIWKDNSYPAYKITLKGKEIIQKHGSLLTFLLREITDNYNIQVDYIKENNRKKEIDDLTIKQLKGNIFQMKRSWLMVLVNAVISIGISVVVALIVYKMGIN